VSGYTIVNLRDLPDAGARFGLRETLAARFARKALESERSGLSLQRLAPAARSPFGHRHREQEETYVVLAGSGRIRLGDEVRELRAWDAIRVAPAVMRAFEAGPDGLEYLAFGAPVPAEQDSELDPQFWPA
jgi:mannose-6-phosphate isomerase-like protein (cupin superfamily)